MTPQERQTEEAAAEREALWLLAAYVCLIVAGVGLVLWQAW